MSERPIIETPTTIIGAGPSGLAAAVCLKRHGLRFELLERADSVGSTWRKHYDRLHLHTVKQHSSLPHMAFPKKYPRYVSRQQLVDYMDDYARRFDLAPRFGEEVASARRRDGLWCVDTARNSYRSRSLIVATGYNRVPKRPTWPGQESFGGAILHSSEYKNGAPFRGQRVMVVGIGNSGGEIAMDLWEHGAREVSICVRGPVHVVPRDLLGTPIQIASLVFEHVPEGVARGITDFLTRHVFDDFSDQGLRRPPFGIREQITRMGKIPLIDVGTGALIKQGAIAIAGAIERFTTGGVVLVDGSERALDAVVCATGYNAALEGFLEHAERYVDSRGYPTVYGDRGQEPGLYFIGYRNPITGALRESAIEAERVAERIAESVA